MEPRTLLIVGLIAAALAAGGVMAIKPRGIRNRNPGNIEFNPANAWDGQSGSDGRYAIFDPHPAGDFVYGSRAAAKLLRNYQRKYGLRTIAGLIQRWAPHHENPTQAYVDNVAAAAGVGAYERIDLEDAALLERVLVGVFRQENGGDFVPLEDIRAGIALAG